jgi:hypothetical protein
MGQKQSRSGDAAPARFPAAAPPVPLEELRRQIGLKIAALERRAPPINPSMPEYYPKLFNRELGELFNEQMLVSTILYKLYGGPQIGDYREGGVVFYVDPVSRRALVAATQDVDDFSNSTWGRIWVSTETEIGLFCGLKNTKRLCALGAQYQAAYIAQTYQGGNKNDWYLPSKQELWELYQQRSTVNKISRLNGGRSLRSRVGGGSWYWSSSQRDTLYAWFVDFSGGHQHYNNKSGFHCVRPVRTLHY